MKQKIHAQNVISFSNAKETVTRIRQRKISIRVFFRRIFWRCDGVVGICTLPDRNQHYISASDSAQICRFARRKSRKIGNDIYFGMATRDGEGDNKDNIVHIPALWCNVDFKDTPLNKLNDYLNDFPHKPSIAVESGGSQHLYWLLKEPAEKSDIATVENINRRIANALGGDMGSVDVAKVLRVPNTHNYKYDPPRKMKIRSFDKVYYSLDDFDSLPALPEPEEPILETDQPEKFETCIADYVMPIDDFCDRDIKPRETILDPWLKDPCMIMVWATRGVGKTFFVMTMLDALSKGSDLGPWKCEKPVNTLFLDGEMPEEDLLTRSFDLGIFQSKRLLRKAKDDLANHRPYMKREKKFMILLAASMVKGNAPSPNLLNPQVRDDLKAILIKNKIKILAIDNLTSLSPGIDENSKKDYDPINRWLIELRSHGISTIIVHHAGKSGDQRGTSGREDNLDISIKLEHPSGYSIEDGASFEVHFTKARVPSNDLNKITNIEMCLREQPGNIWDWSFTEINSEKDNAKQIRDYKILKLREKGLNQKDIAEHLNISQPLVSNVIRDARDRKLISANDEKLTEKGKMHYENGE